MRVTKFRVVHTLLAFLCMSTSLPILASITNIQGISSYYDAGLEQYRAALYVDSPSISMSTEEALASAYTMAFRVVRSRLSARTWIRDLSQRAAINNDTPLIESCSDALIELGGFVSLPFIEGDIIELKRDVDLVEMWVNGVAVGRVEQAGLFELLLNAWVGLVPPSSSFKRALLSSPVDIDDAIAYERLSDMEDRQARVNSWIAIATDKTKASTKLLTGEVIDEVVVADALTLPAPVINSVLVSSNLATNGIKLPEPVLTDAQIGHVEGNQAIKPGSINGDSTSTPPINQEPHTDLAQNGRDIEREQLARERDNHKLAEKERLAQLSIFRQNLKAHPTRFINYPARALAKREEGVVELLVMIDRKGEVLNVTLDESSSYARLDRAAITAVKKASPFPGLPELVSGEHLEFVLPLAFRLAQ